MLKRNVRNLAVAGTTIVSAALLTFAGAGAASASTGPTCSAGGIRACVEDTGSGLTVTKLTGWAWNHTSSPQRAVHVELYTDPYNAPPTNGWAGLGWNCSGGTIAAGGNSSPCTWPGGTLYFNQNYYICAAAWQETSSGGYNDVGWRCVYVWKA